ncbi:peptidase family C50-domain-containing protein [Absidia repens]|uniref:separase n=1 Tax=Absidia repens TaxID=90262 RepID=A0A1X2IPM2_9FUNG|nr:peptidase family C50-domain-containing protein [Absidia repens]
MQICLDQKHTVRNRIVDNLVWPRCIDDTASRKSPSLLAGQTVEYFAKLRDTYQQEHNLDDKEFQTQFIDILPPHWTVCSLSLDPILQELYVTRYCSGKPPHVVKLPLDRADGRSRRSNPSHANAEVTYEQALVELEDIIQRSDKTIHFNKETLLVEDVENWWMIRSELDTRMKKLLEQIERSWIGGFKGFFCGRHQVHKEAFVSFQRSINHILLENIYGPATPSNKCVLDIDEWTLHMILRLGANPIYHDLEDIVYFLLSFYEYHDICIDYSDTIIRRMTQQIRQAIQYYHDQGILAGINTLERMPNEHIILIPDKFTQQFPWESIPILRSQPVSRLPCISFLPDLLVNENQSNEGDSWKEITVDSSMSYYLLNPSGDLKYTQANFENVFLRMESWEGHVQRKPTEVECRSMLIQKDLYMYFGHGAGQSIIRGQIIRQLPRCPVALLMGCSSGRLQSNGEYDTDGYVMNYLLAGSPAVVVNLWDVTDKSIDQVGKGIMDRWGLFNGTTNQFEEIRKNKTSVNTSLVEALCLSRDDCTLPYLTGAATVVYGVPVYVL